MSSAANARRAELSANLAAVRARIEDACAAAGRDPSGVTLVVVTKTFPASDVALLSELGVRDVGENRDQEASAKKDELATVLEPMTLRWHCIGRLQTNKARSVAAWADAVHSVDSQRLVKALGTGLARVREGDRGRPPQPDRTLDALVQVSLDGDTSRGGAEIREVPELCEAAAATEGLLLRGVMAVAPLGVDPRQAFARLAEVAEDVRRDHPGANWISAGMSGDLEAAIPNGATHLRVGGAVLGNRPYVK